MRVAPYLVLLACADPVDDEPPPTADPSFCEAAGWTERPWQDAESSPLLGALAGDLTIATETGPWVFSEQWTGCETWLFLLDQPAQNGGIETWSNDGDVSDLLRRTPDNTHLFFVSNDGDDSSREAAIEAMKGRVTGALEGFRGPKAESWQGRVHFIGKAASELPGWLGAALADPGWGIGIDRFQHVRYVGSFADPERYSAAISWFEPNLAMAANEAIYYNFESDRQDRLDAQQATVVPLWSGEVIADPGWAGQRASVDVALPTAAELEAWDTLELDLSLLCQGEGEFGFCPAWDYINNLWLCDRDNPDSCGTEIGRWITTYHREGRWVHDITPLLALLKDGGTRRFQFYSQQPYETWLSLRFSHQGRADRPVELLRLWSLQGGSMVEGYNDRPPVELDLPADAARVELVTAITGHGMIDPGNCAEFCEITHHFRVNGAEHVQSWPIAGETWGCMDQAATGTIPNQYGTWWYGRNGWCPGREVELARTDITADARLGQTNSFEYDALFGGEEYKNGATTVLEAWVAVYKEPGAP